MPKQNPYKNPSIGGASSSPSSQRSNNSTTGSYSGRSIPRPTANPVTSPRYSSTHNYSYRDRKRTLKICSILLPLLIFAIGQIIQYIVYVYTGRVLVFDLIFSTTPLWTLIVSSILGAISTTLVCVFSWRLADESEELGAWVYIIISCLCFAIIPCISGYLGIVATALISWWIANDDENYIAYIIVLIVFVVGQALLWVNFSKTGEILILTDLVSITGNNAFNIKTFSIIMSVLLGIASVIIAISIGGSEVKTQLFILVPYAVFLLVLPALSAILLLIFAIVIAIEVNYTSDEDKACVLTSKIIYIMMTIAMSVMGIVAKALPAKVLDGYELVRIDNINEIDNYSNLSVIAFDISKVDGNTGKPFSTGENCETLVLVGNSKTTYKGLSITTSAVEIILKNINISGTIKISSTSCSLTIYGTNSVVGNNGRHGGIGWDGGNGDNALICENITFKGSGSLELTPGDGGSGGTGERGSDGGFLFGDGSRGGRGGDGGNSGYAIFAKAISCSDFTGKLILHKGIAGLGGQGGQGGSGGLFGSNGNKGWDGNPGKVNDYANIVINIDKKQLILK